jgi:hypothetical protein
VAQDAYRIEHYVKQQDGNWLLMTYDTVDNQIHLMSIDCTLTLEDTYNKVDIDPLDDERLPIGA